MTPLVQLHLPVLFHVKISECEHVVSHRTAVCDPVAVARYLNNNEWHFGIVGELSRSYLTAMLEYIPEHSLADLIEGCLRDFWGFSFVVHLDNLPAMTVTPSQIVTELVLSLSRKIDPPALTEVQQTNQKIGCLCRDSFGLGNAALNDSLFPACQLLAGNIRAVLIVSVVNLCRTVPVTVLFEKLASFSDEQHAIIAHRSALDILVPAVHCIDSERQVLELSE